MFSQLPYLIAETLRGWWHHRASTWPALLTTMVGALLLIIALSLLQIVRAPFQGQGELWQVHLVLQDSIADSEIALKHQEILKAIPHALQSREVNRAQALQDFGRHYGEDILQALDSNPLPPSIVLQLQPSAQNLDTLRDVLKKVEGLTFVQDVAHSEKLLQEMEDKREQFAATTALTIFATMGALWLILGNTIRLSLYARKNLVETLHVLGARKLFIAFPFMLENGLQTTLATGLAAAAAWPLLREGSAWFDLQCTPAMFWLSVLAIFGLNIALVLGVCWRTLRGFLKLREDEV